MSVLWSLPTSNAKRLEILGDSRLIIHWVNGLWRCKFKVYDQRVAILHSILTELMVTHGVAPRQDCDDWGRHIYRELNAEADALASRHSFEHREYTSERNFSYFRLFFDGSCSCRGSGGGWALYGSTRIEEDSLEEWTRIADMSFPLGQRSTMTITEMEACLWAIAYLAARLQGPSAVAEHLQTWRPLDTSNFQILELSGLMV